MHIDLTALLPAFGIFASFIAHIISDHIKSSRHAGQIESIIGKITPYLPAAQAAITAATSVNANLATNLAKVAPEVKVAEQVVADVAKTV